ncbi:hypothetical protein AC579_953 [Pseudocercospora musae]|uniref:Uncharacterized protein n=1 Tax=Pseudocercospora musae TaxID=113226 RepID=A0A139IUK2_9PEZI|nr:hypothetical protein AC579_953 [Pseudocercospora musae]
MLSAGDDALITLNLVLTSMFAAPLFFLTSAENEIHTGGRQNEHEYRAWRRIGPWQRSAREFPLEIRSMIYEYSVTRHTTTCLSLWNSAHDDSSLSRTSYQIRREALPIYTASNGIPTLLPLNRFRRFAHGLGRRLTNSKPIHFGSFRIRVAELKETDLPHILLLFELVQTGRLRLTLSHFSFVMYEGHNELRQLAGGDIDEAFKAAFIAA